MKRDVAAVEVFLSLEGRDVRVGRLTREPRRGFEAVGFSYADAWLEHPDRYALQPGLVLAPGTYAPPAGRAVFGAIGDSAPDTWGRSLLRRAERRAASSEGRSVRLAPDLPRDCGARWSRSGACARCALRTAGGTRWRGRVNGVRPFGRSWNSEACVDDIRVGEVGAREEQGCAELGREGVAEDVPVVESCGVPAATAEVAVGLARSARLAGCDGSDLDVEQLEQFVETA